VRVGERVFHGERSLEEAAAHASDTYPTRPPEQVHGTADAAHIAAGIAADAAARRTL